VGELISTLSFCMSGLIRKSLGLYIYIYIYIVSIISTKAEQVTRRKEAADSACGLVLNETGATVCVCVCVCVYVYESE
jgi:hypothetical protein